jgi:hypothetical protein
MIPMDAAKVMKEKRMVVCAIQRRQAARVSESINETCSDA